MSISPNTVNLASVILNAAPAIIALIKSDHAKANPGAPPPTDAEVLAELQSWATSTLAIDEAIKAEGTGD
jgi:hypothetical protein